MRCDCYWPDYASFYIPFQTVPELNGLLDHFRDQLRAIHIVGLESHFKTDLAKINNFHSLKNISELDYNIYDNSVFAHPYWKYNGGIQIQTSVSVVPAIGINPSWWRMKTLVDCFDVEIKLCNKRSGRDWPTTI